MGRANEKSGMDAFREMVKQFRGTMLLAVGGSSLLPIAASFAKLDPPWPDGVVVVTSIAMLVVIIFVFQFLDRRPKRSVDWAMILGAIAMIVFGLVYFTIFEMFVFTIPTTGEAGVAGCGWTTHAKMIAAEFLADPEDGCPGNYQKLLESAEYEGSLLWRSGSLTVVKLSLLSSWLFFFCGICLVVAAFVTFQRRRKF